MSGNNKFDHSLDFIITAKHSLQCFHLLREESNVILLGAFCHVDFSQRKKAQYFPVNGQSFPQQNNLPME